jgi:hypothetical protein
MIFAQPIRFHATDHYHELLDNLILTQLDMKFPLPLSSLQVNSHSREIPTIYGTRMCIAVPTRSWQFRGPCVTFASMLVLLSELLALLFNP